MSDLPTGKRTLALAELLQKAIAARLLDVHTALPARVQRYDSAKQTVDVQPLIKAKRRGERAEEVTESLPVIANVPVVFPGAGGMRVTFPIALGDTVLLVFSESSLDVWQHEGGGPVDPHDVRRFHLNDAIAIPGLHDDQHPWQGAEAGVVTIGKDDQPSDFVALSTKVHAEIQALRDEYAAHGHNVTTAGTAAAQTGTTGAPAGPALVTPAPTPPLALQVVAPVGDVASATVKIKG